jgi:membrane fusion protein (multidrug efflux system)
VARNENGEPIAFVVDAAGKVSQRVLKTGATVGDSWLVTAGLAAGDRLVVAGMQKIKDGDKVKVVTGDAPGADAATGAAARDGGPARARGSAPAGTP